MNQYNSKEERKKALKTFYRQLSHAEKLLTDLDYKRAEYPEGSREYETTTETMRCVLYRLNSISDAIGILEAMEAGSTKAGK